MSKIEWWKERKREEKNAAKKRKASFTHFSFLAFSSAAWSLRSLMRSLGVILCTSDLCWSVWRCTFFCLRGCRWMGLGWGREQRLVGAMRFCSRPSNSAHWNNTPVLEFLHFKMSLKSWWHLDWLLNWFQANKNPQIWIKQLMQADCNITYNTELHYVPWRCHLRAALWSISWQIEIPRVPLSVTLGNTSVRSDMMMGLVSSSCWLK